ncbi:amidophosphoribosyltransferase [Pseudobacteriovorax antillogorgiicola]|uniref:Amidophosphoribosyltransferase n=1 Tax=Pseudobacteriovorax antillogorgiicola TaxID=1513793 RepID=A0A1Y6B524_9BACT|nr:amidophosphoribosyltransferase [Pseudobacteriovorax antillogorgiicola]TCS59186.1 amidophosphoribosyltransferase [Pseudobacteriovorax antillogorgiicola]SME90795.1 amidophosphoribosyltransferase [Pseudobacteriovorax antillogorgiicola]
MAGFREECGVVGVVGDKEAANLIYLSLYALQHRGQEAAGIVTLNKEGSFSGHKAFGLVGDGFNKDILDKLEGKVGIGHNRYSTAGGKMVQNIQPFSFNTAIGSLAIAHNGNLTNASQLRKDLEKSGSIFQSTSDTEIFMHLLARSNEESILERIIEVMKVVKGAYSLLLLTKDRLFALRDPFGFRPLVLGRRGEAVVVVSETCALDLIDAEFEREIAPGEVVEIHNDGSVKSYFPVESSRKAFCSFEPIYFARPDSQIFNEEIYELRKKMGAILARESHVDADVVIAVPDSGVPMALGYGNQTGLPMELGLVRNHYVGRTFIEPSQSIRDFGVKLKLNPVMSCLKDKRVIVVDDSLVRGTTSVKILRMIRQAGAREIHMRLGSPPITHSCYFGVDTPERSQLLAAQRDVEEMRDFIGADSLGFLSIEGLKEALGAANSHNYCYGCFNGDYPEDTGREIEPQPTDDRGPGLRSGI